MHDFDASHLERLDSIVDVAVATSGKDSSIVVFDTMTLEVEARIPAGGAKPDAIAVDPVRGRVFSACANRMVVALDAKQGMVLAKLSVGERVDRAVFDPGSGVVWLPGGDTSLVGLREEAPGTFVVAQKLTTRAGARTIALDRRTHRLYLPSAEYGPKSPPSADQPKPKAPVVPGSCAILEVAPAD